MRRTPLRERKMPDYTRGEEITNMVTHIVGGALGVLALVLCPVVGARHHSVWSVVSGTVFAFTLLVLYTISSVYHGLSPRLFGKRVMQVLDHCSIFLLIAGTYTPITLCALRAHDPALGWWLFGAIWALAALGITFNAIDLKKYDKFSMACYLLMGWAIVMRIGLVRQLLGPGGFWLLLSGGLAYTVGAVLYVIGRKRRYAHSAFHVFVVIGSLLHFLCILLYVI
ncbi:MAG: hemolysin III family protein [Clostridia bacterium]|nr:hemolysin III family protein [Clostridia bacterium]